MRDAKRNLRAAARYVQYTGEEMSLGHVLKALTTIRLAHEALHELTADVCEQGRQAGVPPEAMAKTLGITERDLG